MNEYDDLQTHLEQLESGAALNELLPTLPGEEAALLSDLAAPAAGLAGRGARARRRSGALAGVAGARALDGDRLLGAQRRLVELDSELVFQIPAARAATPARASKKTG